ncbi:MAG TPA: sulfite exporter TauE/SafE family protein [Kofleriaceae bacterium]|nr:sulfite exporter TauE/SafE family protein [Kofleriaceae bacterium]
MIALCGSVLAASAVGSVHCAAMCGPLTSLYLEPAAVRGSVRAAGRRAAGPWQGPLAHSLGRLAAYVTLGAIAGGLGGAIDLAGRAASVQRAAMVLAAGAIVAWGTLALAAALGVPVPRLAPRAWNRALVTIRRRRPTVRAALIGLLSAALPCGWLWAFVMVAGGTGAVASGMAVMAAFWLGTVPMMMGVGTLAQPLVRRLGARLPVVTAVALIAVGVVALAARTPMLGAELRPAAHGELPSGPTCHGGTTP